MEVGGGLLWMGGGGWIFFCEWVVVDRHLLWVDGGISCMGRGGWTFL